MNYVKLWKYQIILEDDVTSSFNILVITEET
jgi:hypothetical protein